MESLRFKDALLQCVVGMIWKRVWFNVNEIIVVLLKAMLGQSDEFIHRIKTSVLSDGIES